jgi:hypothetical protein
MTTACLPNDPDLPAVGIRIENGVIELLLPVCPGETIRSAEVTRASAKDVPSPSWVGRLYQRDATQVVRLGNDDGWKDVHGDYSDLEGFSVDIRTSARETGLGIDARGQIKQTATGFDVDGVVMTRAEYRKRVAAKLECSPGAPSSTQ